MLVQPKGKHTKAVLIVLLFVSLVFCSSTFADVIINVLAVNGKDQPLEKEISFSLPGEIKPEDVLDPAGLSIDYNVNDAGYSLHGTVLLEAKETKTFRVRVRDVWRVTDLQIEELKTDIEDGFREMGGELSLENGEAQRTKLLAQLDGVLAARDEASGDINTRIDAYRAHLQTLKGIQTQSTLIDFWRSDATDNETRKNITYVVEVKNPGEKAKKVKEQHYLPAEVRPEYIVDRQGYEVRFDEKKNQPFLFKEDDFAPQETRSVRIGIKDVWFISKKQVSYVRDRSKNIYETIKTAKYASTAATLLANITNNLDLIDAMQATEQPDIKQHIGAYRINSKRFSQAKEDLDALEKLLARYRAELEKSRIKNVMQKIQSMKSLARVAQAMFDKKITVNAAWKIIGGIMVFLAFLTIIHFITWFIRSGREKKQEEIKRSQQSKD